MKGKKKAKPFKEMVKGGFSSFRDFATEKTKDDSLRKAFTIAGGRPQLRGIPKVKRIKKRR